MCAYYPEQPAALIFCNTEARFDIDLVCGVLKKLGGSEVANLARLNFTNPTPKIIEEFKQKCVPFYGKNAYKPEEISRCIQRTEVFEYYCKNEMQQFNYLTDLHKIRCPTLLMVGEKSPGHPPKAAREMAESIPKKWVTYYEFKDAGAPVYKDSPTEAYQVIKDFIDNIILQ